MGADDGLEQGPERGAAGGEGRTLKAVVVEELLVGQEATILALTDGTLLARRLMLFDRFVWRIDGAFHRDLDHALAVIDRIAEGELRR